MYFQCTGRCALLLIVANLSAKVVSKQIVVSLFISSISTSRKTLSSEEDVLEISMSLLDTGMKSFD